MLDRTAARRHEFAVRAALGASRWQLVRQLLVESLLIAAAGAELGIGLLFEMDARDPMAFAAASVVLLAVVSLAGWLPARRAARLDPATTLRRG
jgi:ABC-type antimicrobial peptide transport system permease subunit